MLLHCCHFPLLPLSNSRFDQDHVRLKAYSPSSTITVLYVPSLHFSWPEDRGLPAHEEISTVPAKDHLDSPKKCDQTDLSTVSLGDASLKNPLQNRKHPAPWQQTKMWSFGCSHGQNDSAPSVATADDNRDTPRNACYRWSRREAEASEGWKGRQCTRTLPVDISILIRWENQSCRWDRTPLLMDRGVMLAINAEISWSNVIRVPGIMAKQHHQTAFSRQFLGK